MLGTLRFCLNASIINHCFSRVFWLFEEYYYKTKKLATDSFLAKFHDTIFIEAEVDLIILVHTAIFLGFFSV